MDGMNETRCTTTQKNAHTHTLVEKNLAKLHNDNVDALNMKFDSYERTYIPYTMHTIHICHMCRIVCG